MPLIANCTGKPHRDYRIMLKFGLLFVFVLQFPILVVANEQYICTKTLLQTGEHQQTFYFLTGFAF